MNNPSARLQSDPQSDEAPLILVVEDDYLIAKELAGVLAEGGFAVLGPVSTVQTTLHLLAQRRPVAAVLDVALRNEVVTPVARALQAMAVPFVVASAYSVAALRSEPVLAGAPMLGKPTSPAELIAALRTLLG